MYDEASLICQRRLPCTTVESSVDAGWHSVLLEKMRWRPGRGDLQTLPSSDFRIGVALSGFPRVEAFTKGRWIGTEMVCGAIGLTAAGEEDRLRWCADGAFETVNLFLPRRTISSASDHLRRAGQRVSERALLHLAFADPAVTVVVNALLTAVRQGMPDLYAEQTAHWLALHLLVNHTRAHPSGATGRGDLLTDRRLGRVIDLIKERYAEPLSLEVLASEACVSKFHFARLFRLRTGVSPHVYLLKQRMDAARRLLVTTNLSISEISQLTGFGQATHFGVAFKKANGITPSEYRRCRP